MELFWEKGYHGTSVQDLVKHLGINRASLYDTFGDKHQLFVRALTFYAKKGAGPVIELLQGELPLREKMNALLQNAVDNTQAAPGQRGCFMMNATCELAEQDQVVGKLTTKHMRNMVDVMEAAVRTGQERGELAEEKDPRAVALHLFNTYNGMMLLSRSGAGAEDLAQVVELALSVLDH